MMKLDFRPSTYWSVLQNVISQWGLYCLSLYKKHPDDSLQNADIFFHLHSTLDCTSIVFLLSNLFFFFNKWRTNDCYLSAWRKNTSKSSLLVPVWPVYEFKPIKNIESCRGTQHHLQKGQNEPARVMMVS